MYLKSNEELIIESFIKEWNFILDEDLDLNELKSLGLDDELINEIINLKKIKDKFKSAGKFIKRKADDSDKLNYAKWKSKEFIESCKKYIQTGDDEAGVEAGFQGEIEKLFDQWKPSFLRGIMEVEVELYSKRWKKGFKVRDSQIKQNKSLEKKDMSKIMNNKDKAFTSGFFYREYIEKQMKRGSKEEKEAYKFLDDLAVKNALGDYDKDLLKDFIDSKIEYFTSKYGLKKLKRILAWNIKRKGLLKGSAANLSKVTVYILSLIALKGLLIAIGKAHLVGAFVGVTYKTSIPDYIQDFADKVFHVIITGSFKNEEGIVCDYLRKLSFVKEGLKPPKVGKTELEKFEKRNGFKVPVTGKIDKVDFEFDFENRVLGTESFERRVFNRLLFESNISRLNNLDKNVSNFKIWKLNYTK
jgi:hypothetical protein